MSNKRSDICPLQAKFFILYVFAGNILKLAVHMWKIYLQQTTLAIPPFIM